MNIVAIAEYFKKILFPVYCFYCKSFLSDETSVLCKDCIAMIQPVVSYPFKISEASSVSVFSIGAYRDPLRRMILSKQYRNRYAARGLGVLIWQLSDLKNKNFDYIVPLPLHWSRYAYRWYNQAEEMAETIAQHSNKPVVHLLKRKEKTNFQAGLSKEERIKNVKHVFKLTEFAHEKNYQDATFVLVDDVMTTGSTVFSAIKTLRLLRPKEIIVVVACRVI